MFYRYKFSIHSFILSRCHWVVHIASLSLESLKQYDPQSFQEADQEPLEPAFPMVYTALFLHLTFWRFLDHQLTQ